MYQRSRIVDGAIPAKPWCHILPVLLYISLGLRILHCYLQFLHCIAKCSSLFRTDFFFVKTFPVRKIVFRIKSVRGTVFSNNFPLWFLVFWPIILFFMHVSCVVRYITLLDPRALECIVCARLTYGTQRVSKIMPWCLIESPSLLSIHGNRSG